MGRTLENFIWSAKNSHPTKWRALQRPDFEQPSVAFNASLRRSSPAFFGTIAGVGGLILAPCHSPDSFFQIAAQVIPVFLLALIFDSTAFGIGVRANRDTPDALLLESVRRPLEYLGLAVLILGEADALKHISDPFQAGGNPRVVALALGWGLVQVCVLAIIGRRRPAINLSMRILPNPGTDLHVIELGMGNMFGDEDVSPLVNFMVPADVELLDVDAAGAATGPAAVLPAPTERLKSAGELVGCKYTYPTIELRAGQSVMHYYLARMTAPPVQVQLKLSHARLPRGAVVGLVEFDGDDVDVS